MDTSKAASSATPQRSTQAERGAAFRDLHRRDGIFVMANAWNAGSAVLLVEAGFAAIGTTSAGIAYSLALPDYQGALDRDTHLAETARITAAVDVPVSVDAENGYGHDPEDVADTIRAVAAAGAVGAGIEDWSGDPSRGLYDPVLGAERIAAAREAADSLGFPFTLTARAECYLADHPDPLPASLERAHRYREAGADCLFVPGVRDAQTIGTLVRELGAPVSVVMGLAGAPLSVAQLADLGVRRVSIGGSLARATLGLVRRAAEEILRDGSFEYAGGQIPDRELTALFAARRGSPSAGA